MKSQKKTLQQFNQFIIIMEVHIGDKKNCDNNRTKSFHFDLPKDTGKNLKHEIDSVIRHNELLAEQRIKSKMNQLSSKYKQGNVIHEQGKQ